MIASGQGKTAILNGDMLTVHEKGPRAGYLNTKSIPVSSIQSMHFDTGGMVLMGTLKLKLANGSESLRFYGQQNDVFTELHRELLKRVG